MDFLPIDEAKLVHSVNVKELTKQMKDKYESKWMLHLH